MEEKGAVPSGQMSNQKAIDHTRSATRESLEKSRARIQVVLQKFQAQCNVDELTSAVTKRCKLASKCYSIIIFLNNVCFLVARVAIHFHPDRHTSAGHSVTRSLVQSGIYKSQFETQISNGGLSAFPGGERYKWEERLFAGA